MEPCTSVLDNEKRVDLKYPRPPGLVRGRSAGTDAGGEGDGTLEPEVERSEKRDASPGVCGVGDLGRRSK